MLTTRFDPKESRTGERIKGILDTKKKRRGIVIIAISVALCLSVGVLFGCVDKADKGTDETKKDEQETEKNEGNGFDTDLVEKDDSDMILIDNNGCKVLGKNGTSFSKEGEMKFVTEYKETVFNGTYPVEKNAGVVRYTDINGDSIKDYVLVITAASGTGVYVQELHVFDGATLELIEYDDPYTYIKENVKFSSDEKCYYVDIGNTRSVYSKEGIEAYSLTEPYISPVNVTYDISGTNIICTYQVSLNDMNTVFLSGIRTTFSWGRTKLIPTSPVCINSGDAFCHVETDNKNWTLEFNGSKIVLEGRGKRYVYADYRGDEPEMADFAIGLADTVNGTPFVTISSDEKYAAIRYDTARLAADQMAYQSVAVVDLGTGKVIKTIERGINWLDDLLKIHGLERSDIEAYEYNVTGKATAYGIYCYVTQARAGIFRIDDVFQTFDGRIQLKGHYTYDMKSSTFSEYTCDSTVFGEPLVSSVEVDNIDMLTDVYDDVKSAAVAFLKKDTAKLEELTGCKKGMLSAYKDFKFGEHSIKRYMGSNLIVTVDIKKSALETVKVGQHTVIIELGVNGVTLKGLSSEEGGIYENSTQFTSFVARWLKCGSGWYISETDENFNVDVIYFLHSTLGEATPDEYKKLAEKNFGISNLKIPESWIGDNGKVVIGRGGNVRYYTVLDEGNVGGGGSVTVYVQFYGDSMKTIKSHTVEYIFKDMGTYVQFVSCNVAVREEYEPGGYSV